MGESHLCNCISGAQTFECQAESKIYYGLSTLDHASTQIFFAKRDGILRTHNGLGVLFWRGDGVLLSALDGQSDVRYAKRPKRGIYGRVANCIRQRQSRRRMGGGAVRRVGVAFSQVVSCTMEWHDAAVRRRWVSCWGLAIDRRTARALARGI